MKTVAHKLMILFIICFTTQVSFSQRTIQPISECPNPDGWERAQNRVMFFLTLSHREEQRQETGATEETVEQIRPVDDETSCSALSQIVQNTPKYKNIDDNLDNKDTIYYYQTDNFYYIFWDRKPEYDNKLTGPKTLFIIVSGDFEDIWEFYF